MRLFALFLILGASLCSAEAPDTASPVVRFSVGLPVLTNADLFGVDAALLLGSTGSPIRFGVQAIALTDIAIFVSPNAELNAVHGVVGYELSRTGVFSAIAFGGAGMADWVQRGKLISSMDWNQTYERETGYGPSLLVGINAGVSIYRHFGISMTSGLMVNRGPVAFANLQLDAGNW
jgi:hypothetical protein